MPVAKKKTAKKKTAKKAAKKTTKKKGADNPIRYSAAEEFASSADYYKGEDLQAMRREINGKVFRIEDLERVEFDDDVAWLLRTSLEKAFRLNPTNGRNLAQEFGDNILSWVGESISTTVQKYKTGYGVVITPVVSDEPDADDDLPGDDDLE